jgi:hypothetical protein
LKRDVSRGLIGARGKCIAVLKALTRVPPIAIWTAGSSQPREAATGRWATVIWSSGAGCEGWRPDAAIRCTRVQTVEIGSGGRFELYSERPIRVPAAPRVKIGCIAMLCHAQEAPSGVQQDLHARFATEVMLKIRRCWVSCRSWRRQRLLYEGGARKLRSEDHSYAIPEDVSMIARSVGLSRTRSLTACLESYR